MRQTATPNKRMPPNFGELRSPKPLMRGVCVHVIGSCGNMINSDLKSGEVDHYISTQSVDAQKALEELRAIIWESAPYVCELLNYNIPAFALVEGGKREQQIMIAGYKRHVGFYPHPDVIEHFKEQLSGFKYAKGSIQFPLNKPLPKELVINMIKCRLTQLKQGLNT